MDFMHQPNTGSPGLDAVDELFFAKQGKSPPDRPQA
jgi:hypothetical protein